MTRFPLAPLMARAGMTSHTQLIRRLHLGGGTVTAAERDGLSWVVADRWACRLGFHPITVWPAEWADIDGDPDAEAVAA